MTADVTSAARACGVWATLSGVLVYVAHGLPNVLLWWIAEAAGRASLTAADAVEYLGSPEFMVGSACYAVTLAVASWVAFRRLRTYRFVAMVVVPACIATVMFLVSAGVAAGGVATVPWSMMVLSITGSPLAGVFAPMITSGILARGVSGVGPVQSGGADRE